MRLYTKLMGVGLVATVLALVMQGASGDLPSRVGATEDRDASSFSIVTVEPLPATVDEAVWDPHDLPAGGMGRLVLVARDAAGDRTAVLATVYESGTERELFSSRTSTDAIFADLPPGRYDVRFNYGGVIGALRIDDVELEAERHVIVEAGGPDSLSRLSIAAFDALGEPTRLMASVLDGAMQTELTRQLLDAGGTATLDVLPGAYQVYFAHAVPITSEPIEVQAGEHAKVVAGGYGRLVVNVGDREGVFVTVYQSDPMERMGTRHVNGEAYFDLPPGTYNVHLSLEPAVQLRNVRVTAGQAVTAEAPADGALRSESSAAVVLVPILIITGVVVGGWLILKRGLSRTQS